MHQVGPRRTHPHPGEDVEHPAGAAQIAPRHPWHRRDSEVLGMRLQHRPGEARARHGRVGLLQCGQLAVRVAQWLEPREAAAHLGKRPRAELQQRARARDRDGRVPEAAGGETGLRRGFGGLLPEPTHRRDHAVVAVDGGAGLDPPVLALGRRGLSAQEHHTIRIPVDRARHLLDVGHEGGPTQDEVIGGEDRDRRSRVAPRDPLRGVQDRGGGAPVSRLGQEVRRPIGARELLGDVVHVLAHGDHDRAIRRDAQRDAIQGLPQQAAGAEQLHELLRPLLTEQPAHERAQTHALAAREHDGPQLRRVGHRATR